MGRNRPGYIRPLHCYACDTTAPEAFTPGSRSRCIKCTRRQNVERLRTRHVYPKKGHHVGGRWYPSPHLCPGEGQCAVFDMLTRQFIREQQPTVAAAQAAHAHPPPAESPSTGSGTRG